MPSDGLMVDGSDVTCNESALTGESEDKVIKQYLFRFMTCYFSDFYFLRPVHAFCVLFTDLETFTTPTKKYIKKNSWHFFSIAVITLIFNMATLSTPQSVLLPVDFFLLICRL